MGSIRHFVKNHRVWSGLIVLVVIGGGYYWRQKQLAAGATEARYVVSAVEQGTLVTSISGTGQVSAVSQVDVKAKASGDILSVPVASGDVVKAGAVLASLDAQTARNAVRDASASLESAKISLAKLQQPTDQLTLLQAQNALVSAKQSKQTAQDDLKKAYDDGFTAVENTFLDVPDVVSGVYNIIFTNAPGTTQWYLAYYTDAVSPFDEKITQYGLSTKASYERARASYDKVFADYKATNRYADPATVRALVDETYGMTKDISDAVKTTNNFIQFYKDTLTTRGIKSSSYADTHLSLLNTYTGTVNSHLNSLLTIQRSIQTDTETITGSDRTIAEKTASLDKLQAGTDPLDLASAQLSVTQRQNALIDAQETFANYTVRAPFDGVVAKVSVKKGDSLSSGTAVATMVTKQLTATISLNEVDVAKVKVGQKATLTFDAIDGLELTGVVSQIDTVGTVSQGVVSYNVIIVFDTQDERVKPGMSVSAAIITLVKPDVILVPSAAVKTQGNNSYIEMFTPPLTGTAQELAQGVASAVSPERVPVTVGVSNDTDTEIISGVKVGDLIVTRTITAATKTTTQAPSIFGAAGVRTGGATGGAARAVTR